MRHARRASRSAVAAVVDQLEARQLLAAVAPTADEQYVIELINRGRANPTAEAARYGIDLNEGLAPGTISSGAKQPLANSPQLNDAIRNHVNWLRTNSVFQHAGAGGTSPTARMIASGYQTTGNWGTGENLALTLEWSAGDLTARTEAAYRNLFVDSDVSTRGHRINLMNSNLEELGSGQATGPYTYNGTTYQSVIIGQDFAFSSGNPFLTGVAFNDNVTDNDFYTPGEGLGAVSISAVGSGGTFTTTTGTAGGYSLQLPAGTYTLTASGSLGTVTRSNVVIGSSNVKQDFQADQFTTSPTPDPEPEPDPTPVADAGATLVSNVLTVEGTDANDLITVTLSGSNYVVQRGSVSETFVAAAVHSIVVNGNGGNDLITIGDNVIGCTLNGGAGNDAIVGSSANDRINGGDGNDDLGGRGGNDALYGGAGNDNALGGAGKDSLFGEDGDDRLAGAGSADQLYGGGGNDRLYGNDGGDLLDGGGNVDRLYGGEGDDSLQGGSSNDRLYGEAGNDQLTGSNGTDYFDGGAGTNHVRDRASIETILNATY